MKLQAPAGKTGCLFLNGQSFVIDDNGQVDVPDYLTSSMYWLVGYTPVPDEQTPQQQPQ